MDPAIPFLRVAVIANNNNQSPLRSLVARQMICGVRTLPLALLLCAVLSASKTGEDHFAILLSSVSLFPLSSAGVPYMRGDVNTPADS